jgi:methyl-accepting chemotaxis protein
MYVLGGSGIQKGRYLIPPPGHADGEDAWGAKDAHGEPYVQRILEAATEAVGRTVHVTYSRQMGSGPARERRAAVSYFQPWDWVIVAEIDVEEAVAPLREVRSSLAASVVAVVAVALLLLVGTIWAATRGARRLAAPLEAMAEAAERISEGDVRQDVTYRSEDEIGRLAEAFRGTIRYIQEVARGADALARGDLSSKLVLRSERDELTHSFQAAQSELRRVVDEMGRLTSAAVEGRLATRADTSRLHGEFRTIAEGVNATLETLVGHLDAMPAPAMIVGPDFDIRYMNGNGASLLGRTPAELVGTKCYDGFRMGDCRTPRCAAARAMREDREVSSESDAHPEGLDLEVVYTAVPLRDGSGKVVAALEVVTDQTAVKRASDGSSEGPECRPCLVR